MGDELSAIVSILSLRTGAELRYSDENGSRLAVADNAEGYFVVTYQPMTDQSLESAKYPPQLFRYGDAASAAGRFLAFRRSLRLGFDFEDPVRHYNPAFGDHKTCACGHSYIRHFNIDSAATVPCRCGCKRFSQLRE